MTTSTRHLLAIACAALLSAGCTRTVYITEDPPAPQAETRTPAPGPKFVWIDGHWQWNGHRYVWVGGHWEKGRGNHTWVAGHWDRGPHGWRWVPGHWRK